MKKFTYSKEKQGTLKSPHCKAIATFDFTLNREICN